MGFRLRWGGFRIEACNRGRTVVHPLAFPPVERAISHAGRCGLRNVLSTLSNEGPLCTRSPSHPWSERFCVQGDAASETFFRRCRTKALKAGLVSSPSSRIRVSCVSDVMWHIVLQTRVAFRSVARLGG